MSGIDRQFLADCAAVVRMFRPEVEPTHVTSPELWGGVLEYEYLRWDFGWLRILVTSQLENFHGEQRRENEWMARAYLEEAAPDDSEVCDQWTVHGSSAQSLEHFLKVVLGGGSEA